MLKPTSHMAIDSSKADPRRMKVLEEILYGTDKFEAQLPYPGEILDLFSNDPALGIYQEPERPDNNMIARGEDYSLDTTTISVTRDGRFPETGEDVWYLYKKSNTYAYLELAWINNLLPGEGFTVSAWVRGSMMDGLSGEISLYPNVGTQLIARLVLDQLSEWTRVSFIYTNNTDSPITGHIRFYPYRASGSETWFTSPKLEHGTVVTPWPPTPYSVSGYSDIHYSTGTDLRGFKDEGIYTIHENSKLTEQGVGLYGL